MRRLLISFMLVLFSSLVFAETVKLRDGSVITGEITSQNEDSVTINTKYGEIEILKSDVIKIEYQEDADEETASEDAGMEYERNGAFAVRPLSTIIMAALGYFDIYFEGMTAYNSWFAMNCMGDFRFSDSYISAGGCIGPQFNLSRKYLNGIYMGVYPGYQFEYLSGYKPVNNLYLQLETGYQKVTKGGFLIGFYTGYTIASESSFKIGIKIGGAFPDPLFKIEKKD